MQRILIIEDDRAYRKLLCTALEQIGYEVLNAENGEKGLALFDQSPVHLVIVDIFMPVKEGFETIMELRQRSLDLKILAISGGGQFNAMEMLPMAVDLGADEACEKPIHISRLLEKVSQLLMG